MLRLAPVPSSGVSRLALRSPVAPFPSCATEPPSFVPREVARQCAHGFPRDSNIGATRARISRQDRLYACFYDLGLSGQLAMAPHESHREIRSERTLAILLRRSTCGRTPLLSGRATCFQSHFVLPSSVGRVIIFLMVKRCAKCGAPMSCSPEGNCWCKELPPLPASPNATGCLCPECLREKLRESEKTGSGRSHSAS
jgi:hypothetical protein